MNLALLLAQLPALAQAADAAQATVAAIVAAVRAGRPDFDRLSDEQIVAKLVHDASTGEDNADALLERLRAGLPA